MAIVAAFWLGLSRTGQSPPTPEPTAAADDHAASAEQQPAVAPATGEGTGDDAVLADVQRLIAGSSALRDARIEIAVANGIVTLSGEAPTTTTRDLAVSLAGTAHGVKRVFSMVEVTPAVASTPASRRLRIPDGRRRGGCAVWPTTAPVVGFDPCTRGC